jgi:tryptophan synthase beta chain
MSPQSEIKIPDAVREAYAVYHPSPLIRATGFEKALDTPAKSYFKNEGVSPTGSHP